MTVSSRTLNRFRQRQARGFTLVELMVSVTIALFLIGGALAIVGRTRSTFAAQNQLAQLQDNERLAMTLMTEVIESGGYFPAPQTNQASTILPPVTGKFLAGQAIYGTSVAPGDQVSVRFGTGPNDNVYGCTGVQNTTAAIDTYTNFFFMNGSSQLACTFTNAAGTVTVPLVNGITNLAIFYGVRKSTTNTGSCTDTYLTASQLVAADWPNVCSVKVRITFTNPIITTPGATTGTAIIIERVIAVMTTVGVNS